VSSTYAVHVKQMLRKRGALPPYILTRLNSEVDMKKTKLLNINLFPLIRVSIYLFIL